MNPTPTILYGEHDRLEPLDYAHADQLLEEGNSDEIWRYMPIRRPTKREEILELIDKAWKAASLGDEIPFAIIADSTGRGIGRAHV